MRILFLSILLFLYSCGPFDTNEKKLVPHIPIYNPEGEKFARDQEFYKAYNKYQSRTQQKPQDIINNLHEESTKETKSSFINTDGIDLAELKDAKIIEYDHSSDNTQHPSKRASNKAIKEFKRASQGFSNLLTKGLNRISSKINSVLNKKHKAPNKNPEPNDSNKDLDQATSNEPPVQNFLDENHSDSNMDIPADEQEPDLSSLMSLQLEGQSEEILSNEQEEETAEEEIDTIQESPPDDDVFLEDDDLIKQDIIGLFDKDEE